jgi:lysophospholipase L1-like esterase
MRRLCWLAPLLVLLALLVVPVRADDPVYIPVGPGDVYLALGDSLAVGYEVEANGDGKPGYPDYFYPQLRATQPISYTNLGVTGETTTSMLAEGGQLDTALAFIASEQAAGRVVSPVTLDIGGNDVVDVLLGEGDNTVTETLVIYQANLELILDELITALTVNGERQGDLLITNFYNPYPDLTIEDTPPVITLPPDQEPIVTNRDVPKFNAVVAAVAAARGIPVFDAFSAFEGKQAELTFVRFPYNFNDFANLRRNFDFHPREAGHIVLADGFASISQYPQPVLWLPLIYR